MIYKVELSKRAEKDLRCVPPNIISKLKTWVSTVEELGLLTVRKVSGFHDEPLKGDRLGQRSIRLNKAYRAIYIEKEHQEIHLISVMEVNKHGY